MLNNVQGVRLTNDCHYPTTDMLAVKYSTGSKQKTLPTTGAALGDWSEVVR